MRTGFSKPECRPCLFAGSREEDAVKPSKRAEDQPSPMLLYERNHGTVIDAFHAGNKHANMAATDGSSQQFESISRQQA